MKISLLGFMLVLGLANSTLADDTARALAAIKNVAREGQGNNDAGPAWKYLVHRGVPALLPTLASMKDASPVASNWLRTVVQAIAENERKAGRKLPVAALEAFVKDVHQAPAARRLGYELLLRDDSKAADRLLAGFVNDPSLDLRRDAVAFEIEQNEKIEAGNTAKRIERYRRLFASARDKDQVEEIAAALAKLGTKVSIPEHFGYVTYWQLIGPFDSTAGAGFSKSYPPEAGIDLAAKLKGKGDSDVTWVPFIAAGKSATVDLNTGLGKHKDAAAYAFAAIVSHEERAVEVRIASQNAIQIFLNGKKLFAREEYHHGARMDQHVGKGVLKPGKNDLLIKVCQNNQDQSWAQVWGFSCRLCDETGGALPVDQLVMGPGEAKAVRLGFMPEKQETEEKK